MSQVSQDFIFATLMLAVGLLISILGVYSTLRQKLYYNPTDNSVATEIDIPILGKLKTNVPALVLCFIGLVPIVLAYNEMQGREQALVKFRGKVAIDPSIVAGIKSITVARPPASGPSPPRRTLQIPPWTCRFRYRFVEDLHILCIRLRRIANARRGRRRI